MQMNKQHGIKIFGMEPLCLALLYVILIVAEEKKIGINRDEYLGVRQILVLKVMNRICG